MKGGCITYQPSNSVLTFQSFISHHATMHVNFDMERCNENTSDPDKAALFIVICGGKPE
jgi:hypothetical protein